MKHSAFFILVLIILVVSEIDGQYNYNNYKYPDLTVKGLNVGLFLYGNGTSYTTLSRNKTYYLDYNFDANYFRFVNNSHQQKTDYISLNHALYKRSPIVFQNNYVTFNLEKSQINRKYFHNDTGLFGLQGKFFEINHKFDAMKSFSMYDNFKTSLILSGGIGFGRLQPVSEVFNAQFLMDDLMQQGQLSQKFSEEELFELAALMAKIKNTRLFDYRRANIFQLKELSKWFQTKGLTQDIDLFTTINDNWSSNLVNKRLEGSKISFNLNPWVDITRSLSRNKDNYGVAAIVNFVRANNINQHFGSETMINISHNVDISDAKTSNPILLSGIHRLLFNPNSRTIFGLGPALTVAITDLKYYGFLLNLQGSCSYFINNQTRISGNIVLSRNQGNSTKISNFYAYINEFNNNFITNSSDSNLLYYADYDNYSISANINFSYSFF